jgi:hypothetical protein
MENSYIEFSHGESVVLRIYPSVLRRVYAPVENELTMKVEYQITECIIHLDPFARTPPVQIDCLRFLLYEIDEILTVKVNDIVVHHLDASKTLLTKDIDVLKFLVYSFFPNIRTTNQYENKDIITSIEASMNTCTVAAAIPVNEEEVPRVPMG